MTRQEASIIIFVIILLVGNIFFAGQYLYKLRELNSLKNTSESCKINAKIVNFSKMFIKSVLRSQNEIDFETRLKLENAVRNTGSKVIMTDWQNFIDSKTESQAQENVKNLLETLINNIQGQ